jgi:ribosomal protein S18 acetylase RimI-like enzyme
MTVIIEQLSLQEVVDRVTELQTVYEAMYGLPPRSGDGFVPFLLEHSRRVGFRLCISYDLYRALCVGFGYGFTGLPGQPWRDELAEAVGAQLATEWLTGHFEFAEFGVIPSVRRHGIGTRLYGALFGGLPHERAILTVREENLPARRFYQRHQWRAVYDGFFSRSGRGPYIVMGKMLKGVP